MLYLLDVSLLIALIDRESMWHELAHAWFARLGSASWATCPVTENGVTRILSQPGYPNPLATPADVIVLLRQLREAPGHVFLHDNVSLADPGIFTTNRLRYSGRVTDTFLLGMAKANNATLVTVDRRINTEAVADGEQFLLVLH